MSAPQIFNTQRIKARRQAFARQNRFESSIHQYVGGEIAERIQALDRTFPRALEIGTGSASLKNTPAKERINDLFACDIAPAIAAQASKHKAFAANQEALPLKQKQFDLIASILNLHHVNDLPGALLQCRRALRSKGTFLAVMFGEGTLEELRASLHEAELLAGREPQPRIAPFAELPTLGNLLARAGFLHAIADIERLTLKYESLTDLVGNLRAMGETGVLAAPGTPLSRTVMRHAEDIYRQRFPHDEGGIRASFPLVYLIGHAPDEGR
ncbi:MAG: methyltransferase domain-containing protein [Hyphomicrobiales bacterium]|nr:methyltransferase domain-containing protein [Hyphomicrobiales bacterium]